MIIEVARITIKDGQNEAFEAAVAKAVPIFNQAKGCKGLHLQRCIEEPNGYEVIIRWETLENHTVDFRESELFQQWRELVGPHFAGPPDVTHFNVVMDRVEF